MSDERIERNGTISDDGQGAFRPLPEGEYTFRIKTPVQFRTASKSGNEMAVVVLSIDHEDWEHEVKDNLVLIKSCEWKLASFFRAIGLKKHGVPLVLNWNRVPGTSGRCKVKTETYKKDNGDMGTSNKVAYYIDAPERTIEPIDYEPPTKDNDIPF